MPSCTPSGPGDPGMDSGTTHKNQLSIPTHWQPGGGAGAAGGTGSGDWWLAPAALRIVSVGWRLPRRLERSAHKGEAA